MDIWIYGCNGLEIKHRIIIVKKATGSGELLPKHHAATTTIQEDANSIRRTYFQHTFPLINKVIKARAASTFEKLTDQSTKQLG